MNDSSSFIIKRDGSKVDFDPSRIQVAIEKALSATGQKTIDSLKITEKVCQDLFKLSSLPSVEKCQDLVEEELMSFGYHKTAKAYILYREERNKLRGQVIPDEWKKKAKEGVSYFKSIYQWLIYCRTYARWNGTRRETWPETISRYMEFMKYKLGDKLDREEYNEIEEGMLKMNVLPSMRGLQFSGIGLAADKNNLCMYNCAYLAISSLEDLCDLFQILLCGTGCGFSCEKKYVDKLPEILKQTGEKSEKFVIPDSREGWVCALKHGLECWFNGKDITFDYSLIRPSGARLVTSGGHASGPQPLKDLMSFLHDLILRNQGAKLQPFDIHRICCMIGRIVVVGGVRRASLISLSDLEDEKMKTCKDGAFWNKHPELSMSNNSAVYNSIPSDIELLREWNSLANSGSGERGIFNRVTIIKTLPDRRIVLLGNRIYEVGTNPCSEIRLISHQLCNLTTICCRPTDTEEDLKRKIRLATILGTYQATLTDFVNVSDKWKKNVEEERLLGVSMTGICDCRIFDDNAKLLQDLKKVAIETNQEYADKMGIPRSTCITCVKPEGTTSELLGTSSGIHPRFSDYYIRRVRMSANDPLAKMLIDEKVPHFQETGQLLSNVSTWVFEFPLKSPEGSITADQLTAVQQLEKWKLFRVNYVEHSVSCTVYVSNNEWIDVLDWVKKNWNYVDGIAFLPKNDHVYQLAPFEAITKEEYEKRVAEFPEVDPSKLILYEQQDNTNFKKTYACIGDKCYMTE